MVPAPVRPRAARSELAERRGRRLLRRGPAVLARPEGGRLPHRRGPRAREGRRPQGQPAPRGTRGRGRVPPLRTAPHVRPGRRPRHLPSLAPGRRRLPGSPGPARRGVPARPPARPRRPVPAPRRAPPRLQLPPPGPAVVGPGIPFLDRPRAGRAGQGRGSRHLGALQPRRGAPHHPLRGRRGGRRPGAGRGPARAGPARRGLSVPGRGAGPRGGGRAAGGSTGSGLPPERPARAGRLPGPPAVDDRGGAGPRLHLGDAVAADATPMGSGVRRGPGARRGVDAPPLPAGARPSAVAPGVRRLDVPLVGRADGVSGVRPWQPGPGDVRAEHGRARAGAARRARRAAGDHERRAPVDGKLLLPPSTAAWVGGDRAGLERSEPRRAGRRGG